VSIAEAEVRLKRIAKPNAANIVTLDIERFKGAFTIPNWRGLEVYGEFWDLGDYRRTIGRRIHPDEVTLWPRTICVAWRRYGTKPVQFVSEWGDGREAMLREVWRVYDEADIVIGHNVDAFDTKLLKAEWWRMGLPAPRPFKSVDTLKVTRREFKSESNTLDSLVKRLNRDGKTDKYDVELARAALDGDVKAQKRLMRYNQGDIEASECLYDSLRGWMPTHPFIGTHGDEKRCNQCQSDDLTLDESARYRAVVLDYALYRCGNCGANVRGGWVARAASTRGAR
jgi:hypothetical protein